MVETGSLIKMLPSRVMRCTQLDCVGLAAQSDLSEDDCRNNRNEYSGLHTEKYQALGSIVVSTLDRQSRSPGSIPGRGKNFSVPFSAVVLSSLPDET